MADSPTVVEGTVVDEVDDLAAAYAEIAPKPYRFSWAGQEWMLPHLGGLDYRLQAEIENVGENLNNLDYLEGLFARMFGAEQAARWAEVEVPTPVLFMLFDRWVKHSGAKPGEGEASKPSSRSTGRRSRPTSAASTTSASRKRSTAKKAPAKAASPPVSS